jgi:hypothetical protein
MIAVLSGAPEIFLLFLSGCSTGDLIIGLSSIADVIACAGIAS